MPKGFKEHTKTPTQEEIDDILTSDLSIRALGDKHGLGYTHVRNILKRAGIVKTTKSGAIPKIKPPKPPKVPKEKSPKLPKIKSVKQLKLPAEKKLKELPIKVIKKEEIKLTANTKFELQKERLDNAKLAAEKYKQTEIEKLNSGWKYITRIGKLNIKETVLVKV